MMEPESEQTAQKLSPEKIASVRRRMGFVAALWWIAAVAGAIGIAQVPPAGWLRLLLVGLLWLLAIFFSFAWWTLRNELPR